jgi:hypothetical protein
LQQFDDHHNVSLDDFDHLSDYDSDGQNFFRKIQATIAFTILAMVLSATGFFVGLTSRKSSTVSLAIIAAVLTLIAVAVSGSARDGLDSLNDDDRVPSLDFTAGFYLALVTLFLRYGLPFGY